MARYRYEIDESNVLRMWDDVNTNELGAPFRFQPIHPDGRPWANREEAEQYALSVIREISGEPTE